MPHFRVRIAALVACASLTVGLATACTPREDVSDDLVVVTTFTVVADMVHEVAGDRVRVESLTRTGVEVHGYEPTASDVARTSQADLVVHHGLGLEDWFADFMDRVDAPHVTITDGIEPMVIEGSDVVNPHAWMSISNATVYVRAIEEALSSIDPDGAAAYEANADRYLARIDAVGVTLLETLAEVPADQRLLVTCEGAFSYLARDAAMDEAYLWPVNADMATSARSVAEVIDAVRERQVRAVFCESTVSADTMMQVVREAPTAFGGTLYVDSLTGPDGPAPTYLDMLDHNARVIAEALAP